jgi:hypothetical protein
MKKKNNSFPRFPQNARLRISFADFLFARQNSKRGGLAELTIASKLNPSLNEEFLIYRYKFKNYKF